jgi:hypothetical protein
MNNNNDLKLLYLYYAIRNELGRYIKPLDKVIQDQSICLCRIAAEIKDLKENGKSADRVIPLNHYTYEILLNSSKYVDTTEGRINVSFGGSPADMRTQYVDLEVKPKE